MKIAKIPKGPAVAGVVTLSKTASKQRLTSVIAIINFFNITASDYIILDKELEQARATSYAWVAANAANKNIWRVNHKTLPLQAV